METDPGKHFLYCSGCSHILMAIVQQATGVDSLEFANQYLFQPLGIKSPAWETDRDNRLIGGWGLSLTPREMAKLGYLFLHNGTWDGRQVVSSGWVKTATTRHIDTGGRLGYGYQWWIYPTHHAYAALGHDGQTIFIAPDLNLIIVTTAQMEEGHDPIYGLIDNYILPAVREE
jgi:CubicO group peptidase (beta-lactamase class C family)